MRMIDYQALPNNEVATQTGTVSSTAITLVSLLSGGALHAQTYFVEISVEDADIRLTDDGTTPVAATLGLKVTNGSRKVLSRAQASAAKIIATSGTARVQICQKKN